MKRLIPEGLNKYSLQENWQDRVKYRPPLTCCDIRVSQSNNDFCDNIDACSICILSFSNKNRLQDITQFLDGKMSKNTGVTLNEIKELAELLLKKIEEYEIEFTN